MMKQQNILEDDLSSASDLHATTVNSCSENIGQENGSSYNPNHQNYFAHPPPSQSQPLIKKKRSLPGNPDPEAEVISLSPKTLMATNRFVCEMCNKGFQRDQNLQLHRRGHNLPWKLKQRNKNEVVKKKVYVCPEVNCVHHEPSRALGDLTGIKKHFCRKHGEKKWKCDKCSKRYAVQSDWKAHSKTCGTREYKCDCGTLFSRYYYNSFIYYHFQTLNNPKFTYLKTLYLMNTLFIFIDMFESFNCLYD
ncbi:putative transcription factor C2H2 family [Helianthus anomalus]